MELLQIKPQANFPREDMSDENKAVVAKLLFEPEYIDRAHELAEEAVTFYKIGHKTLQNMAAALQMDMNQYQAFSYGAKVFEMTALTVRPETPPVYSPQSIHEKVGNILSLQADGFGAGIQLRDQEERLGNEVPNVMEVVDLAAALRPTYDPRLVRTGAALERNSEYDLG